MLPWKPKSSVLAVLGLILALPMLGMGSDPVLIPEYQLSPNPAPADAPFTLRLNGFDADCKTVFSRESVTVIDRRINLTFMVDRLIGLPQPDTTGNSGQAIVCPDAAKDTLADMVRPYLDVPTFAMPALKAGNYEVWATGKHPCLYTVPICKMAALPRYAGTLTVDGDGKTGYSITPSTVQAGSEFKIGLLSYAFNCATTYDMLASAVVGDTLTLTFLDHADPLALCPAVYKPYGPSFKINGLRKGKYHVLAYRLPQCAAQGCKMAAVPEDAGVLTVVDDTIPQPERKNWFLKESQVASDKAFKVQLLNNAYGNCQTSFAHPSLTIETGAVHFKFLVENHPERVCVTDIRPHGPVFEMPAMKPGIYPVWVNTPPACTFEKEMCLIAWFPALVDTLIVSKTSSILLSALRSQAAGSAAFEGARVMVSLPEGAVGEWRAELLTVAGQRLAAAAVRGAGGLRTALDLGMRPERGVYMLRLSAPDGKTHTLPLVRKD